MVTNYYWLVDSSTGLVYCRMHGMVRMITSIFNTIDGTSVEGTLLPVDLYQESVVGQPPVWPRLFRDSILAATDYIESPSRWATLSDTDKVLWAAWRVAIRGLPAAQPDATAVTWPGRPDGVAYVPAVDLDPAHSPEAVIAAQQAADVAYAEYLLSKTI